ncbi:hypothetical protein [Variovorax sp. PCZ-1]|uniref:hypothetical protein n=1 Tax=Variovorax sp. PCZ-1 TaxID=2835533 RepID=UPI001BD15B46|nr:hypothetical protein [Variovorax sp. PCZ-1]MBS7807459.1 hypothetical protein [Variovorax sp. PCZ-1]
MLYSDEFISSLRNDPIAGTKEVCDMAFKQFDATEGWTKEVYEAYVEAYLLIVELVNSGLLPVTLTKVDIEALGPINEKCGAIHQSLWKVVAQCDQMTEKTRISQLRSRFKSGLGVAFAYEFSQGDLGRVQVLLNELRDQIGNAKNLDPDHRQRLMKRLESLQSEMHKRVSDLDRFWGLIGDAGVVLAKLGNDAKPIVDRIREIADIVWQTQGRAEELPSGAKPPQIGHDKNDTNTSV